MIRTFTFVMLLWLCMFDRVEASSHTDSNKSLRIIQSPISSADTSLNSASHENLLFTSQNLLFKRGLDSLENAVPLDYNEHVQGYIDIYLNRKAQIGKMLGLSEYYFPIFEKALKEAGLPDEIKYMTVIESALNPLAISRSGAVGPWQFMYATAKGYGLVMDSYVDERRDPVKASYAAAHYIVDAYKRIGDWLLTIAAFNCGTGAVTRAIAKSGGVADFWKVRSFLPKETQNYVPAFIATVYAMNNYQKHGIQSKPADFSVFTDVFEVNRQISISSIAKAANLDLKELLILNPSYKKQIINGSAQFPKSLVIPGVNNSVFASLYDVLNGGDNEKPAAVLASSKRAESGKLKTEEAKYDREIQNLVVLNQPKTISAAPSHSIKSASSSKISSPATQNSYMSYIVKVGDTLSGIAEKFNGMTVSKIKALNGLTRSAIVPGMKLIISHL